MSRGVFSRTNNLETACNNLPVSRSGAQPGPRWLFHNMIVSRRCVVAYLARSIDPRCTCTQPDSDASFEQFSLLFLLRLPSDMYKREAEISRKSANCKAQISTMCGVNDTDLFVAICRFSQVVFVTSNNFTHNLLFYFQ